MLIFSWLQGQNDQISTGRVNSANYESLVLRYKFHFITFGCYHDHLQERQVVINDSAKEFSTMLRGERSNELCF